MNSSYAPGPAQYSFAQRNWFSRNWKWFVPVLIVAGIAFVGGLVLAVFGLLKANEPYKHAVALVMHDTQATNALGAPVQPGWLVTGSIRLNNDSGTADLAISVRGQLHKGTVYVVARKSAGKWSYQRITLLVDDTNEWIDLLPHTASPPTQN